MTFRQDVRRIATLAWPVFIGQVAVLAFSALDTMMLARYAAADLAALAVGSAVYISVFVGLMGVVLAVGPIAGQLFGAGKLHEAGAQFHQAVWLALGLAALGCIALLAPAPFLHIAQASPEVEDKIRSYLAWLAFALPPAIVFQAFRGFNNAVSRPKVVMLLQVGSLVLKLPINALLIYGTGPIPAMGAAGCGLATAIVVWCQFSVAWWLLRHDKFYAPFGFRNSRLSKPNSASLKALLKLGVPMGLSIMIEVSGFMFMAVFIARLGATPVAGHQLAANLVSMMFMMPLSIGNAAVTLVSQKVGAGDHDGARRLSWHSLQLGVVLALLLGTAVFMARETVLRAYTSDTAILAAAMPLLAWVAVFHLADALQTISAFLLRAYRIATVPMVVYALAFWGIGLAGGYTLAFNTLGAVPAALQGARGFWAASTTGLVLSAAAMCAFLAWVLRRQGPKAPPRSS